MKEDSWIMGHFIVNLFITCVPRNALGNTIWNKHWICLREYLHYKTVT
jgi:hypothetical protein